MAPCSPPPTGSSAACRDETEVNDRLERKMVEAFDAIWKIHKDKGVSLRTAAFEKALQRCTRAHLHRGFD